MIADLFVLVLVLDQWGCWRVVASWIDDKDALRIGLMSCVCPDGRAHSITPLSARFEDDDEDKCDVRLALHAYQPVDARFLRGLKLQMVFKGGCDKRQIVSGQPPADKGEQ